MISGSIKYEALGIPYIIAIEIPDVIEEEPHEEGLLGMEMPKIPNMPDIDIEMPLGFKNDEEETYSDSYIPGIENYEFINEEIAIDLTLKVPECKEYYHGLCYNALIKLIVRLDEEGVRELLEMHQNKETRIIDVECKCGISHHSNNIAKTLDCFGANSLNVAALLIFQVEEQDVVLRICRALLEFGCDPNVVPSNGQSALDVATIGGAIDLMKVLVEHGADINCSLQRLTKIVSTGVKKASGHDAFSIEPLEMLLCEEVLLCAPDPLATAFYSCMLLDEIAEKHPNFLEEIEEIKEYVEMATFNYVDLCTDTWEAKVLVTKSVVSCLDDRKTPLFRYGIDCMQKHFCSHKFVQHIAMGYWYGDSYDGGGIFGTLKRFVAPILINIVYPAIMIDKLCGDKKIDKFSIEQVIVRTAQVPAVSFAVDVINHITLTVLFLYCCFVNTYGSVSVLEVVLWTAVVARMVVEFEFARTQGFRNYLGRYENLIEIGVGFTLVISIAAYLVDAMSGNHDLHIRLILINRYSYSFAASGLIIKCSMMLKINKTLGPLTETIVRMTEDIVSFLVLSVLLILGFSIPLYTIALQTYHANTIMGKTGISINSNYETFSHTLGYLGYSLFGYGAGFSATISYDKVGSFIANSIYFLYMVALGILLMNLLIAILNSTYTDVYENASREWLFGKIEQLAKYQDMQPFLYPCIIYLYPLHLLFIWSFKLFPAGDGDEDVALKKLSEREYEEEFLQQNKKLHVVLKEKYEVTKMDEEAVEENRKKWSSAHETSNAQRKKMVREASSYELIKRFIKRTRRNYSAF